MFEENQDGLKHVEIISKIATQKQTQRSQGLSENTKIAVVHDWIFERRGGEKVLERILNLFPQAHLYYLFGNPEKVLKLKQPHLFFPSFLNKLPFISRIYKLLLPLLPMVIESFNLSNYDLIFSTSSCVAKGIIPSPLSKHISYIHTPMRYAWDQEHQYFPSKPSFSKPWEILRRLFLNKLRVWDVTSSVRIDKMIANSHFVARRCQLYYGRKAEIIYPPVETLFFSENSQILRRQNDPQAQDKPKKVLLFGAWVPYKKMREALSFLIENKIPTIAAGHGSELQKAYRQFEGKAEFIFHPKDDEVPSLFAQAHILLFPAIEDFGIVPLEATAAGLWVVAPNAGGTKETILNGVTGFTFEAGNKEQMLEAVKIALSKNLLPNDLANMSQHVVQFSPEKFDSNLLNALNDCLEDAAQ